GNKENIKMKKIIVLLLILLLILLLVFRLNSIGLKVTKVKINSDVNNTIRIVQLSDLHNSKFGSNNMKLVDIVKYQNPDLIVMTGDMLNREEERTDIVTKLINSLTEIAPVYYGYGNHEDSWMKKYNKDLKKILTDAGAIVVDNNYVDVDINGNQLRIGGYMGYYRIPGMLQLSEEELKGQNEFFERFEDTERYKILLNHIPTTWVDWGYNNYPVDLVFSGHYHGGQCVLPFIGPLYAPYIGFNPPFVKGIYTGEYATCILSSGLGNEHIYLPRINNPPEIVVVDLKPTTE
ncbi:MAG: metallophosphoesterase, partial [Acetatifactor sp.]|nr:metallophosphoesterase [Acetatifactor sp.]